MEDGISRGLQHHHETCCEKGGCHRRWACIVQRWFYHRDIVSRQVDLYMTDRRRCAQIQEMALLRVSFF